MAKKSGGASKKRWTAADAAAVLERWRQSHRPLATFCREQGLCDERVRRWKRRFEEQGHNELVSFQPVRIVNVPAQVSPLELRLPDGRSIRMEADFDAQALRRLLDVVASS